VPRRWSVLSKDFSHHPPIIEINAEDGQPINIQTDARPHRYRGSKSSPIPPLEKRDTGLD
jgi:hypothetical protein